MFQTFIKLQKLLKSRKLLYLQSAVLFSLVLVGLLAVYSSHFTFDAKPTQEAKMASANILVEPKKGVDIRQEVLKAYLESKKSPLAEHAEDFVEASDENGVDWKLVTAISGVESTFGKFIPGGYNGWGWGVYGTQAIYFKSWRDGIFTVTKGLKTGYIDKGLTTPYQMNRIYAASPAWGWKVDFFLKDIEAFSKKYQAKYLAQADLDSFEVSVAGVSGKLQ